MNLWHEVSLLKLFIAIVVVYAIWALFLDVLVEYYRASKALGSGRVGLVYKPLTDYLKVMKQSETLYGHSHGYYHHKVKQNPENKIVFVKMLGITIVCIVDTQLIKELSSSKYIHNFDRKAMFPFNNIFGKGLMFLNGKEWKSSRLILSNLFHFDLLKAREHIVQKIVEEATRNLNNTQPDLLTLGRDISSHTVLKTLLGEEFAHVKFQNGNDPFQEVQGMIDSILVENYKYHYLLRISIFGPLTEKSRFLTQDQQKLLTRIIHTKNKCLQFIINEKQKYLRGVTVSPFLETYFNLKDDSYLDEALQQMLVFTLAGMDTSAGLIQCCLTYLSVHPEYQDRILDDVRRSQNLHRSKQLNNFINECLRLRGPVQMSLLHYVRTPFTVDGYQFRSGTNVFECYGGPFINAKYWDDALEFNPDRFNKPLENQRAFIPFSSGPRICIGQYMALMETRITLVRILEKYRLIKKGDSLDMRLQGVINVIKNHHYVMFESR